MMIVCRDNQKSSYARIYSHEDVLSVAWQKKNIAYRIVLTEKKVASI